MEASKGRADVPLLSSSLVCRAVLTWINAGRRAELDATIKTKAQGEGERRRRRRGKGKKKAAHVRLAAHKRLVEGSHAVAHLKSPSLLPAQR